MNLHTVEIAAERPAIPDWLTRLGGWATSLWADHGEATVGLIALAVCLWFAAEALAAGIGYALARRRREEADERCWRVLGRFVGIALAALWPGATPPLLAGSDGAMAPEGLWLLLVGAAGALLLYLPLPGRARDGWRRGRVVFWSIAAPLSLSATVALAGASYLALRHPAVAFPAAGGLVGLWAASVAALRAPARRRQLRDRAGLRAGWWRFASPARLLLSAPGLGALGAERLRSADLDLPERPWAPFVGLLAVMAWTLVRIARTGRSWPAPIVRSRILLAAGIAGAGAGGLAMGEPWLWIGVAAIAVGLLVLGWAGSTDSPGAARPEPGRRRWRILLVLGASVLIASIDTTALNVALPTIRDTLPGATMTDITWALDAYAIPFAALLLTAGALGDLKGRKRVFWAGMVIFGVASLAAARAGSPEHLIWARAAMGVGAAAFFPASLPTIARLFPRGKGRRAATSVYGGLIGIGVVAGYQLGGWLVEDHEWRWIFYLNVPIVLGTLIAAWRLLPESTSGPEGEGAWRELDLPGAALSTLGMLALVWAIIEARTQGWGAAPILAAFGAAVVLLALFVLWELALGRRHRRAAAGPAGSRRRLPRPMLPLGLFRNPRFTAATVSIATMYFCLLGIAIALTFHLQSVLGYSPFAAGKALLPVAAGLVIGTGFARLLGGRLGTRWVVVGALVALAGALVVLSGTSLGDGYWPTLAISLSLVGLALGAGVAAATESVTDSLPDEAAGGAAGVDQTARQLGGLLGVAILTTVLGRRYRAGVEPAVDGLPADAEAAAVDSVGGAIEVASRLGAAGDALRVAARAAFVDAMDYTALWVATPIVLLAAIAVARAMPRRERPPAPPSAPADPAPPPDGPDSMPAAATAEPGDAVASAEPESLAAIADGPGSRRVDVDGRSYPVCILEGEGPTVVFFPGLLLSLRAGMKLAREVVGAGRRIVVVDLWRGFRHRAGAPLDEQLARPMTAIADALLGAEPGELWTHSAASVAVPSILAGGGTATLPTRTKMLAPPGFAMSRIADGARAFRLLPVAPGDRVERLFRRWSLKRPQASVKAPGPLQWLARLLDPASWPQLRIAAAVVRERRRLRRRLRELPPGVRDTIEAVFYTRDWLSKWRSVKLAASLGIVPRVVPGGHLACVTDPAPTVRALIGGARRESAESGSPPSPDGARPGLAAATTATGPARPTLRGVLHLVAVPLAAAAGFELVVHRVSGPWVSPARGAALIYALSLIAMFAVSAAYHRGNWRTERTRAVMRKLDHSTIYVFVAATSTPVALALATPAALWWLAGLWLHAIVSILARARWRRFTPWSVLLLLGLAWALAARWHEVAAALGAVAAACLLIGGIAYTLGGISWKLKRPGRRARHFGYHEVLHVLTLVGAAAHFIAIAGSVIEMV